MLEIDGAQGEGGGQVLRTSLALSLITRTPIRLVNIRAGRRKPGLRAQHVTCVRAAAAVGKAEVSDAAVGTRSLSFTPRDLVAGEYELDLGTAGSTALVLQTILPALIRADGPSRIALRGGTHNPLAPPFEFLTRAYFPLLERMGPRVRAELTRAGFYPKGGGKVRYQVEPAELTPLELLERGPVLRRRAEALVANLPDHIGRRELDVVARELDWPSEALEVRKLKKVKGPGNVILLTVESETACEVFSAFGEQGVRAEAVAQKAVAEARAYLGAGVPVGEHLADQLLLLLALAGGGRFRTMEPSLHTQTQIALIPRFLPHLRIKHIPGDVSHELTIVSA